jgi:hypothetical protein
MSYLWVFVLGLLLCLLLIRWNNTTSIPCVYATKMPKVSPEGPQRMLLVGDVDYTDGVYDYDGKRWSYQPDIREVRVGDSVWKYQRGHWLIHTRPMHDLHVTTGDVGRLQSSMGTGRWTTQRWILSSPLTTKAQLTEVTLPTSVVISEKGHIVHLLHDSSTMSSLMIPGGGDVIQAPGGTTWTHDGQSVRKV